MKAWCWLLRCVLCIQLLPVSVECARMLMNVDYLGIGYDALQGNPQSDLEDPGFRQAIFPLEYTKNVMSADRRFLIPDQTSAFQLNSCSFQSNSEEVTNVETYSKSLEVSIFYCAASYILRVVVITASLEQSAGCCI